MNTRYNTERRKKKSGKVATTIIVLLAAALVYYVATAEERAYQKAVASNDNHQYELFLVKYPGSSYRKDIYTTMYRQAAGDATALLRLGGLHPDVGHSVFEEAYQLLYQEAIAKNTTEGWDSFLQTLAKIPPGHINVKKYREEATKQKFTLAFSDASAKNTVEGWDSFLQTLAKIPHASYIDVEEYKEEATKQKFTLAFSSEKTAWEFVSIKKLEPLYKQYLLAYPKGKHARECEKLLIDLEANAVFNSGQYGELPPMEEDSVTVIGGDHSIAYAENETGYTLTILYSGKTESKRLVLAPRDTGSVQLPNGKYNIVASVNSPRTSNFAGTVELIGVIYPRRYFIETEYSNSYMSTIRKRAMDKVLEKQRREMFQRSQQRHDSITNNTTIK
jgi:hypothetical protein